MCQIEGVYIYFCKVSLFFIFHILFWVIVLKKLLVLFFLFLCGCSNNTKLNCSYTDNSSILGTRQINDVLYFKNNHIVSYERSIIFTINSNINDVKSVYKSVKLDGKVLKKHIGGKYKISKNSSEVRLIFNSKKTNNLKYLGIDSDYSYDQVIDVYNGLGFTCK